MVILLLPLEQGYPKYLHELGKHTNCPHLHELVRCFLYAQRNPTSKVSEHEVDISCCPIYSDEVQVFHSAVACFYAPSDLSGVNGMYRQRIRATPSWQGGPARYDCVFVEKDPKYPGFQGLHVAQVVLFFSFTHRLTYYPCALVRWFSPLGDSPCSETKMWQVKPDFDEQGNHVISVIHVNTILRAAHLIPIFGSTPIDRDIRLTDSLAAFASYYVNKFSDYHAHEVAF